MPASHLEPGDLLGPYRIQSLLGVGGMGEVYRARDARLGRDAAVKVISPRLLADPILRRRFEIEARAASVLNHPAIVTVYDVGETDDVAWIAMEWVDGRTLRHVLVDGPLAVEATVSIAYEIADGLAAAHEKGIVHRDLKPENIMLRADGRAKVLDFGLARSTIVETMAASGSDPDLTPLAIPGAGTVEGAILGTVGYMSPEQAAGRPADFRSDQFMLGLILYEMLAGSRAFRRQSLVETLAAIIQEEPPPLASIRPGAPEALQRVISRCLAKDPAERFASTRDLASMLASIRSVSSVDADALTTPLLSGAPARSVPAGASATVIGKRSPRVRRIAFSIAAVLMLAVGVAAWLRLQGTADSIDSLAVLPFQNATGDPNTDYLGDGLTESLIDQMSRVPALRVMARSTVARFRNSSDPLAAGRALGVGAVLTGSITRRDSQLVVSTELVDIASGARLWGETYDRPATDLMRVQDSIALEIVDRLRPSITAPEKDRLVEHPTQNAKAYDSFLRAQFLMQHDTEEDDLEAKRLYLEAIEEDPKFAQAYLGVGSVYARSAGNGYESPNEALALANESLRKVLELDPGNFQARVAIAGRHFQSDWDWSLAEREFRELRRDPRLFLSLAYHPPAIYFWATRRPEESVAIMHGALRNDPQNVESRVMLADFLSEAGRVDEAIANYRAIAASDPGEARPLFGLAQVLRRRGDTNDAIATLRKAYELVENETGMQALAAATTNEDYDRAEVVVARQRLEDLVALSQARYVSPLDLARLHAKVGNRGEAFASLERALAERSPGLVFLKVDRMWDSVRDDPRFAAAIQKIGIP